MNQSLRDDITRLMLATAVRLPMPAPHGCVSVAIRGAHHWDGFARTRPFEPAPTPPRNLIYSLAKTFIATIVLKLAEQKKLGLDAKLADYLPKAPFAATVTIRQLLRHSSGTPDYGALPEYHAAVAPSPIGPGVKRNLSNALARAAPPLRRTRAGSIRISAICCSSRPSRL